MSVTKMEIKQDLTNTLVTRELFEEKFTSQNSWINERFQSMQEQMDTRFQSMQEQMDIRFQSLREHFDLKFNILIGISLLGFTLLNPEFISLIKMFFK